MWKEFKEVLASADWYMTFHWWVLIGLWVMCGYELSKYEYGNALCMAVVVCAWKMKGVEE